jgi:hypothetical protein
MIKVIEEEMTTFTFPKRYLPKVIYILTSGILDLKGNSGTLHFDHDNNLRLIEWPHKALPPNLTE